MNNKDQTFCDALYSGDVSGAIERSEKREQSSVIRNQRIPIKANEYAVPRDISFVGVEEDMDWKERSKIMKTNNIVWTKEQYEKMGVIILNQFDDLFYDVELPKGWQVKDTGHSMWNDVVDNMGRKRISFFYKGAFYDRDAFSNFEKRFYITSKKADYDEEKYEQQPELIKTGKTKKVWVDEHDYEVDERDMDGDCYEIYCYGDGCVRTKAYKQIDKPVYKKNPNYVKLTGYEKYSQPFHYEVCDFDGTVLFTSDVVKTDYEYSSDIHRKFYDHLEEVEKSAHDQCEEWLRTNYPDWESFHAYWDVQLKKNEKGIYLGIDTNSKTPIVFDVFKPANHNGLVLGTPGQGRCFKLLNPIVTNSKRDWCNNWRKMHKLPKRRKGSRIIVFKMKFEHNTTKKQKRRYKKKHCFNPNDITIK